MTPQSTHHSVLFGSVSRYEDNDVIKVLGLFEERITAMKESVAMDMNEKMDTAGNTVSSTKMLQTGDRDNPR